MMNGRIHDRRCLGGYSMPRNQKREHSMALYEAILDLKDVDECRRFFEDLCAATELQTMEQRFDVASLLMNDEVYTEIAKKTNASSATISRVNRMLNFGTGVLPEIIRARLESGKIPMAVREAKEDGR